MNYSLNSDFRFQLSLYPSTKNMLKRKATSSIDSRSLKKGPHPGPFFIGNLRITAAKTATRKLMNWLKLTLKDRAPAHAEVNFYPYWEKLKQERYSFWNQMDKDTVIPLHCDRERKKVIAVRIGAPMYIMWVPFFNGIPGKPIIRILKSGDLYCFDMGAAGWIPTSDGGWRVPKMSEKALYWKHAAGRNLHKLVTGKYKKLLLPYLKDKFKRHKLKDGHTWTLTFSDQVEHNTQGGTFGSLKEGFTFDEATSIYNSIDHVDKELVNLVPEPLYNNDWDGMKAFKCCSFIIRRVTSIAGVKRKDLKRELKPANVQCPPNMTGLTDGGRRTVSSEGWEYASYMNDFHSTFNNYSGMLYDLIKHFGNGTVLVKQRKRLCGVILSTIDKDIPSKFIKFSGTRSEYLRLQKEHTANLMIKK